MAAKGRAGLGWKCISVPAAGLEVLLPESCLLPGLLAGEGL
jgi:hypothetical protein